MDFVLSLKSLENDYIPKYILIILNEITDEIRDKKNV